MLDTQGRGGVLSSTSSSNQPNPSTIVIVIVIDSDVQAWLGQKAQGLGSALRGSGSGPGLLSACYSSEMKEIYYSAIMKAKYTMPIT